MREFEGRTAVITGGASGIGLAIAKRLAGEGMKLVLGDVEEPALETAVDALKSLGAEALGVRTDVSRLESVQELEREAVSRFGKVHLLCNNAGVGSHEDAPIWELPLADWRWVLSVNLFGVIHGVKAFLPGMLEHGEEGHVINTSSGNGGLILVPGTPIYATSKAGVSALTEILYHQLQQRGAKIRASILYPGPHIVSSNIFSASRNRLPEFERETSQASPPITLEGMKNLARQAGIDLQTTAPEEVAEHFLDGVRRDAFYILPESPDGDSRLRSRVESILARRNPEPPGY